MKLPSNASLHDVFYFSFDVHYILFPSSEIISSLITFQQKLLMWKELMSYPTETYNPLEAVIYFQKSNKKH